MELLRPQEALWNNKDSLNRFSQFEAIADELCAYLRAVEGINTVSIHEHERDFVLSKFLALPEAKQARKLERFLGYYDLSRDLVEARISLRDKNQGLKAFLKKFRLVVPEEDSVFEILDKNTFIEVYDLDFVQRYRSVDFLEATNHSVMALESCEWWDLFERAEKITKDQIAIVTEIYTGKVHGPLFHPIEAHTVKELRTKVPLSSQAESLVYSPVYSKEGNFEGGLHLFKITAARALDFATV